MSRTETGRSFGVSEIVQQEGPLSITRTELDGGHITHEVACEDCKWAIKYRHRVDAEDVFDLHECSPQPSTGRMLNKHTGS